MRDLETERSTAAATAPDRGPPAPGRRTQAGAEAGGGVVDRTPGGRDALGRKENMLMQWGDEMVAVAHQYAARFAPLGLHFRPEILLATAMQEAAPRDALTNRSFDGGLGIMQITPDRRTGNLDPGVAAAIGWDNAQPVAHNLAHSRWRDARANLQAGAEVMLGKAHSVQRGVPNVWSQMDEPHRWRAVLFAYNAGQGNAIKALRAGGPNAPMISSYRKDGVVHSHDYTAEIQDKLDYVAHHDPFAASGASGGQPAAASPGETPSAGDAAAQPLRGSVGHGGSNQEQDVVRVQRQLGARHVDAGPVDGRAGPRTVEGIEQFQRGFLPHPDGLIEPGRTTARHLFESNARVAPAPRRHEADRSHTADPSGRHGHGEDRQSTDSPAGAAREASHPTYDAIARNFGATIGGSTLTWHQALWCPRWGRHARPSDMTNAGVDEVLANIQRQAAALGRVASHLGKPIVVHCWLRPPVYNRLIGGAGNSAHLRGTATDFHVDGMSAEAVRRAVKANRDLYAGAGEEAVSWVHLDLEHRAWFHP